MSRRSSALTAATKSSLLLAARIALIIASTAAERTLTVTLTDVDPSERLVHLFPIVPSLIPINTAPDHEVGLARKRSSQLDPGRAWSGNALTGILPADR